MEIISDIYYLDEVVTSIQSIKRIYSMTLHLDATIAKIEKDINWATVNNMQNLVTSLEKMLVEEKKMRELLKANQ